VPCPNPRVIIPREVIPGVVPGAVDVDVRSMGVRTPPCTRSRPSYGIVGLFHLLPPALAWLWRLVAPRGHSNPSIVETEGMSSEGVGSYWPFATGRVDQGRPRQPAAQPDHRDPRGALRPDPQPAHRRLGGRLHAPVDHPRVSRAPLR
jgi:hypothetical protein